MLTPGTFETGLRRLIEPGVRRVVAGHMGVSPRDVTAETSLTDKQVGGAVDVLELTAALERTMGLTGLAWAVREVHSCGDLVGAVAATLDEPEAPAFFTARVRGPDARGSFLLRSGCLSRYDCNTLTEDALRGGPGTLLDVELSPRSGPLGLAWLHARLSRLSSGGVRVRLRYAGNQGSAVAFATPADP
jgi:hypothetical protein